MDRSSAMKAQEKLEEELKAQSIERDKHLSSVGNCNSENDALSSEDENENERESDPSPRRKRIKRSTNKSAVSQVDAQYADQIPSWASKLIDMLKIEQEKAEIRDLEIKALAKDVKEIKKTLDESLRKQSVLSRKVSDCNRVITGKVVASASASIIAEVDDLFDDKSPIQYMNIDRTAEINDLFRKLRGKKDADFVRALGKHFYGDDLYFYMFTSSTSTGKAADRKSLSDRDPEGFQLIQKILKQYWELCVWPSHNENVKRSAEIETAIEKVPGNVPKLRGELSKVKLSETEKWMSASLEWMNDWGAEARKRKQSYLWTESLFGRSVSDADAIKPKNYNKQLDEEWRRNLHGLKRTTRSFDTFMPPA